MLPAVIMEDNSAVVTTSNEESAYLKKCKRFIMVVKLGLIQVLKIKGEMNNADLHIRDKSFATKADNILGSPARLDTIDLEAEVDTEDEY